jgi:signal transduction histidine kinase
MAPLDDQLIQGKAMLDGVARRVATDVNKFFSKERHEHVGSERERLHLARELHDGVLQSLTGVALQLRALSRLVEEYPEPLRNRLRELEEVILEEQRGLRGWIQELKPNAPEAMASSADMASALEALCNRVTGWGLHVTLIMPDRGAIPRTLGDQIYRLVQEALSNVLRHAHARTVRVEMQRSHNRCQVTVEDDGRGFAFHGCYDLATLNAKKWGPVSIKDRVASLGGGFVLTSRSCGSRLEITLPLARQRPLSA